MAKVSLYNIWFDFNSGIKLIEKVLNYGHFHGRVGLGVGGVYPPFQKFLNMFANFPNFLVIFFSILPVFLIEGDQTRYNLVPFSLFPIIMIPLSEPEKKKSVVLASTNQLNQFQVLSVS